MSYTKQANSIREINAQLSSIIPDLGTLGSPDEVTRLNDNITAIGNNLNTVIKLLGEGSFTRANGLLTRIHSQLSIQSTITHAPAWIEKLEKMETVEVKGDIPDLLATVDSLLEEGTQCTVPDIHEKTEYLNRAIKHDLQELASLGRHCSDCPHATAFLAIRTTEALIKRLKLNFGIIPEAKSPRGPIVKHPIDKDLQAEYPGILTVFDGDITAAYDDRNKVIHAGMTREDEPTLNVHIVRMLRLFRLFWQTREIGFAIERVRHGCDSYQNEIRERINQAKRAIIEKQIKDKDDELKKQRLLHEAHLEEVRKKNQQDMGKALIANKHMHLQERDAAFTSSSSDIQLCPDGEGMRQYYNCHTAAIHWHKNLGASMTKGPILTFWRQHKEEGGKLGYPIKDEQPLTDRNEYLDILKKLKIKTGFFTGKQLLPFRKAIYGQVSSFQNGKIYWISEQWRMKTMPECVAVDNQGHPIFQSNR